MHALFSHSALLRGICLFRLASHGVSCLTEKVEEESGEEPEEQQGSGGAKGRGGDGRQREERWNYLGFLTLHCAALLARVSSFLATLPRHLSLAQVACPTSQHAHLQRRAAFAHIALPRLALRCVIGFVLRSSCQDLSYAHCLATRCCPPCTTFHYPAQLRST